MRAGRLRTTARIEQNTPTRSDSGEAISAWSTFITTWPCELVGAGGGEAFRGRQTHASADHVAIGRYASGVTAQMRVVVGSRTFDILRVDNVGNRYRELRLNLRERGI